MAYYFAYGSNLDPAQMRKRCPTSREVGVARAFGWGLRFVGFSRGWGGAVADIVEREHATCDGVVYSLPYDELAMNMDRCEGAPRVYQRIRLNVQLATGRNVSAWSYIKVDDVAPWVPSRSYIDAIWRGYSARGMRAQPLLDALKAAADDADPAAPITPRRIRLQRGAQHSNKRSRKRDSKRNRGSKRNGIGTRSGSQRSTSQQPKRSAGTPIPPSRPSKPLRAPVQTLLL